MPDEGLPAAKRRLAALLRDEEYGPKLARLRGQDERRVLDLVYENRGREARAAIIDLDYNRRANRTIGEKAREYRRLPAKTRSLKWRATMESVRDEETRFWALYKKAMAA